MDKTGPHLDMLTHRLAECPAEFYRAAIEVGPGPPADPAAVDVVAIVSDHFRDLQAGPSDVQPILQGVAAAETSHQKLIAIAIWLLRDEWFMSQPGLVEPIGRLLRDGLRLLSATIRSELTVTDSDRREEMARRCLAELGYRPAGETIEQAADRLNTLDSVEREHVVRKTRAAEARARRIRQEMARQRAAEAVARYSPE